MAGAALVASLGASPAFAADMAPAPVVQAAPERKMDAAGLSSASLSAPTVSEGYQLPEGQSWRYSDFIRAVEKGKVERVRFSKDGSALQLTAVDGCAACKSACARGTAGTAAPPPSPIGVSPVPILDSQAPRERCAPQ